MIINSYFYSCLLYTSILEMLKDDTRSKIVGDVKETIYSSSGVVTKANENVMYIGGFYYEKQRCV